MNKSRAWIVCVGVLICMSYSHAAYTQAFCALRDPVRTIYELYPAASSFQSIVATVDEEARADIATRLDMQLHYGELGQHTLYVAVSGSRPMGLVHVRAERTQWGLAEIAWALDFDLRVVDFRIQRCRAPNSDGLESEMFRSQLRGKSAEALSEMLTSGGSTVNPRKLRLPDADPALVVAVLTSGLKAIAASESVWGDDIRRLKASTQAGQ